MKTLLKTIGVVVSLVLAGGSDAQAQSKARTKSYDLSSSNVSGDQIRGPAVVRADNLNVLRYDYKFNITITFSTAADLWTKLQSVANPAPAAAPEKPSTGAARPGSKEKLSANLTRNVQTVLDQAEDAIKDADAAITGADKLIELAVGTRDVRRDCAADSPADLDITKETNRQSACLADQVAGSATAVVQVKTGGQALIALLQKQWTNPELLIGYINDTLNPTSSFEGGLKAQWPDFNKTSTLKQSLLGWKVELANRTARFNDSLALVSGSLVAAKKALTDVGQTMKVYVKTASGDDQKALESEIKKVLTAGDNLDDKIKQLTKTATLLSWATSENQRVFGVIPDLEPSSTKYNDFQTAQEALIGWRTRMTDLRDRWIAYNTGKTAHKMDEENPSPFSRSTPADCGFSFSRTKTTAITLNRIDLMPGATATGPETVLSVSVECTSPFTASAGVAFSSIEKHEFAIQASPATPPATGTVNKFVVTNNSNFHPLPLGVVHARLCEFNEKFAIHASFGVAGNFQSQSAGGSSAEFLIGPSFSLFRTMFFTPGLHIGTRTIIGGGFNVGDVVPPNITTVPLQKSYTTGFGFAITFTKP